MFALDLRQAVAHAIEKPIVCRQHIAIEVELDERGRTHQRTDQVLMFTGRLDGAGQVAGVNREVFDPAIRGPHRLHDRPQPGFGTIAPQ
ncbi:hypothetical protein D3C84_1128610 [compost metagenome]